MNNLLSHITEVAHALFSLPPVEKSSVLIVEDNDAVGEVWVRTLQSHCEEVIWKQRAGAGLRYLAKNKPDILVLDWRLPNGSPQAVFDMWVSEHRGPLVVISGYLDIKEEITLMKSGAWNVLRKPEAAEMFLEVMLRYIDMAGQLKRCDYFRMQLLNMKRLNLALAALVLLIALGEFAGIFP